MCQLSTALVMHVLQGIMSRVYETATVLFLLSVLVCGLAYVMSALWNNDKASRQALFG